MRTPSLLTLVLAVGCGNEVKVADVQNADPAVVINDPTDGSTYGALDVIDFVGTIQDGNGIDDINSVLWTSNIDGELGTPDLVSPDDQGVSRLDTALSAGTHTITLSATDFDGAQATASITVVVIPTEDKPVIDISSPAPLDTYFLGDTVDLIGSVYDPNQDPADLPVTWRAEPTDGSATISITSGFPSATGTTSEVWTTSTPGEFEIVLEATNQWGFTGEDRVTVTVLDPNNVDADGDGFTPAAGDCDDTDEFTNPDAIDLPDGAYYDDNCDGIDGDTADAAFVALTGTDNSTCDITNPCRTIAQGITVAQSLGLFGVYIQAGQYDEIVELADGVDLWGGYDTNWDRAQYSLTGHETRIVGGFYTGDEQYLTVRARNVSSVLGDMVLEGRDASGTVGLDGKSSYVVHAKSSTVILERVKIVQGDGAPGTSGQDGDDASQLAADDGENGANAEEKNSCCDDSTRKAGGAAGVGTCADTNGGKGGDGGKIDTACSCVVFVCDGDYSGGCAASPGVAGNDADVTSSGFGNGGNAGAGGDSCGDGLAGQDGLVTDGIGGPGGDANGRIASDYWYPFSGDAGVDGEHGGGGGGGGGAGGCDSGIDNLGAAGGGGGAGGCKGTSGTGGGGGGGSFGVFAISSSIEVTDSEFTRGVGASGAEGGDGGAGQPGGPGGDGGTSQVDAGVGGDGGDGGRGGHGGGGGGGSGGLSYGIFSYSSSVTQFNNSFSGGQGGTGGQGGSSSASSAVGEKGSDGVAGSEATCSSTSAC